jgi:SAM-dependent methyltransferase
VDYLLARGMTCVTVLDISGASLCRAKDRLGAQHECVSWIEADVTAEWEVPPVAIWHDRAVFHFLTDPNDRARYVTRLRQAVKPGGTVVLATFAPDGPEKCSGLPVQRYDAAALGAELGDEFALVADAFEQHRTPSDIVQLFCYAAFRRHSP